MFHANDTTTLFCPHVERARKQPDVVRTVLLLISKNSLAFQP